MAKIGRKFPLYNWHNNAGYGTKKHIEAIHKHGITLFHRKSFEPIKSNYDDMIKNLTKNVTDLIINYTPELYVHYCKISLKLINKDSELSEIILEIMERYFNLPVLDLKFLRNVSNKSSTLACVCSAKSFTEHRMSPFLNVFTSFIKQYMFFWSYFFR